MDFELGAIHQYSSLEENSEAFLCSSLDWYKKQLIEHYVNCDKVQNNYVSNSNMNTN